MRVESKIFTGLGLFMLPLGVVYAIVGHLGSGIEIAGVILLVVVAIAFAFIGVYLGFQARHIGGVRPEDWDATPADGEGNVGSFPVSSIYPFLGAMGITIIAFGFVFTTVLLAPGVFLVLLTVIGMARESVLSEGHAMPLDYSADPNVEQEAPSFSDNVKK